MDGQANRVSLAIEKGWFNQNQIASENESWQKVTTRERMISKYVNLFPVLLQLWAMGIKWFQLVGISYSLSSCFGSDKDRMTTVGWDLISIYQPASRSDKEVQILTALKPMCVRKWSVAGAEEEFFPIDWSWSVLSPEVFLRFLLKLRPSPSFEVRYLSAVCTFI